MQIEVDVVRANSGGAGVDRWTLAVRRNGAMAVILPGVLGIVAIVLGMPDWLAAPLLGVGSLIAAGARC